MIVNLATVADSRMILGADSKDIANQKALEMVSHIITKKFYYMILWHKIYP